MRWVWLVVLTGCETIFPLEVDLATICNRPGYAPLKVQGVEPDHYYRFQNGTVPQRWQAAESICIDEGAHLAALDAGGEAAVVEAEMLNAGIDPDAWMGVARNTGDAPDAFVFVTGEPVPDMLWRPPEPDNALGNELAAVLVRASGLVTQPVDQPVAYVCECDGRDVLAFDFP